MTPPLTSHRPDDPRRTPPTDVTLYELARREPLRALEPLRRATQSNRSADPDRFARLLLLYAETLAATGDLTEARACADRAFLAASAPGVTDGKRCRLAAFALTAELGIRRGDPAAFRAYTAYLAMIGGLKEHPEHAILAGALLAVVAYHGDCQQGRRILEALLQVRGLTDEVDALRAGLTAMADGCAQQAISNLRSPELGEFLQGAVPVGAPAGFPPLPVGVRRPPALGWDPRYLTALVRQRPGTHTCDTDDPETSPWQTPPLRGGLRQPDMFPPDPDRTAGYSRAYPLPHACRPATADPGSTAQERP
jgi:hypothetical protein